MEEKAILEDEALDKVSGAGPSPEFLAAWQAEYEM